MTVCIMSMPFRQDYSQLSFSVPQQDNLKPEFEGQLKLT